MYFCLWLSFSLSMYSRCKYGSCRGQHSKEGNSLKVPEVFLIYMLNLWCVKQNEEICVPQIIIMLCCCDGAVCDARQRLCKKISCF